MKRHLALVAATALFASAGAAHAGGTGKVEAGADPVLAADATEVAPVEGEIVGVDHERQTIQLDTGEEFVVAEPELVQLSPGQRVIVPSFEERDGQLFADTVFQTDEAN